MDKNGTLTARLQPHQRRSKLRTVLLAAGLVGISLFSAFHYPKLEFERWGTGKPLNKPVEDPMNPWAYIEPSKELEWHRCFEILDSNFRCARLTVPLSQERRFPEVHIAILMVTPKNATAALVSPKSPLLINPGGPGGVGTLTALLMGSSLQTVLGDDRAVIGFDPRGVGFTTPSADCWATPPTCENCPDDRFSGFENRIEWALANGAYGMINSSNVATKYIDAGHRAVNKLCAAKNAQLGGESILGHAATPHVATDMVSIVDAWERWADRETAAFGINAESNPTKGKLVYWGFSYGTYLGATFASMYPDRVGRVILDGVVDAEYYASPVWAESLLDADKVLGKFFSYCVGAGRGCALYREGDTAADIKDRYYQIIRDLVSYPPSFIHPTYFQPIVLRPQDIRALVFQSLYSPAASFPTLAGILNSLYDKNYEPLGVLFGQLQGMCQMRGKSVVTMISDAQRAIMCGDKTKPVDLSLAEIDELYQEMTKLSEFSDIWMWAMLQCNGFNISRPHPSPGYPPNKQTKTEFPVLFLSNTYDPVTPLHAAVKMALKFQGAGLIEQHAAGHCTVSAVSHCTAKKVRDYVVHGKVPPPPVADADDYATGKWTTCDPDEQPWQPFDASATALSEREKEIAKALVTIRDTIASLPRWGAISGKEPEGNLGVLAQSEMKFAARMAQQMMPL